MTIEKVELELNNSNHACTGHVMTCDDTGRTIASFWHEDDAQDAVMKINNHDKLVQFVKFAKKYSSDNQISKQADALLAELEK